MNKLRTGKAGRAGPSASLPSLRLDSGQATSLPSTCGIILRNTNRRSLPLVEAGSSWMKAAILSVKVGGASRSSACCAPAVGWG